MSINHLEKQLDEYNSRLIKLGKIINYVPTTILKTYFFKKMLRIKDTRDNIFITLREETRKKYPERFIRSNNA